MRNLITSKYLDLLISGGPAIGYYIRLFSTSTLFNDSKVLTSSDKAECFDKELSLNPTLDSGLFFPNFPLSSESLLIDIHITRFMICDIISNLDPHNASALECILIILRK